MDSSPSSSSDQPPKLALYSFPSKGKDPPPQPPPGTLTPPVHAVASVPFQWEEAPGRPRPGCSDESKPRNSVARSLELPPRLVLTDHHQVKVNNSNGSSPTTVLEGPYVIRSLSYALSFRKGGSFRSPKVDSSRESRVLFGSSRWVSSSTSTNSSNVKKNEKVVGGTFDFFNSAGGGGSCGGGGNGGGGGDTKVKITRVRKKRSGSFRSLTHSSSHLLTSVYESFKQVVPWKRRS
ncbi:hypothetical protein ACOSQ3_031941 [Xanthoceras sorbifolium]